MWETRDSKGSFMPGPSSRQVQLVLELEEREVGAIRSLIQCLVVPEPKRRADRDQAIPG